MSDKKKTKTKVKNKGGRPTRYNSEYAEQARKLCLLGYTDKKLADFFNVSESTLNLWKLRHKEFSEHIARGKDVADANVVEGLYNRAIGYSLKTSKPLSVSDGAGQGSHVEQHPIEQHFPPDPGAAKMWLVNRQPDTWRDKQSLEHTGRDGGAIVTKEERSQRVKKLLEKRNGSK